MTDKKWSWIQVSDIHLGSPKSFRFQPAWCEQFYYVVEQIQKLEQQPDFLLVSGDMCRDGDTHVFELEAAHEKLHSLPWPVYCLPGNHDIGGRFHVDNPASVSAESVDAYRKVFGRDYHSFEHKGRRFICLNSMVLGSGLAAEHEQWQWLEQQAEDTAIPTVVLMHSLPFCDKPGSPHFELDKDYQGWYGNIPNDDQLRLADYLRKINLTAVSCGHIHVFEDCVIEGIRRVLCPSTAFLGAPNYLPHAQQGLGFLQWQHQGDDTQVILHALERESATVGYGPGGNIPLAERDYSVAWEAQ